MSSVPALQFKVATEDWEFELVHQLNYRTFVEEIPQHHPQAVQRLVDKFHSENTYLICLSGERLVGMLAVRGNRPFSLDQKLPGLDSFLPVGRSLCEIRLLAVEKEFRNGQVLQGLLALVWQHGIEKGYDFALISGTTRQIRLYKHLGFIPFGPLVGKGDAMFQPMYLTLETFEGRAVEFLRPVRTNPPTPANFLPGPVLVHRAVREAFEQLPSSHRAGGFVDLMEAARKLMRALVNTKHAEILVGTGTLANDVIAAQLAVRSRRGLVLSNGEFGNRLIDHAARAGLDFERLEVGWGTPFDPGTIERIFKNDPSIAWIWFTHCETSTGMLNNLAELKALAAKHGVKVCVDCISSVGLVEVDLAGVQLASGVSGKAIGSYPGLAFIFHDEEIISSNRLPRYLDLGNYAATGSIPFTHSSNLVSALAVAVERVHWHNRFEETLKATNWLRGRLATDGFAVLVRPEHAAPGVVTIVLERLNSLEIGRALEDDGYLISFNSEYLRSRNWIQICLMGEYSREKIVRLIRRLVELSRVSDSPPAPATGQVAFTSV